VAFEHFEHRADIGVRGIGKNLEEAFSECARSLADVMADVNAIEPKKAHVFTITATDYPALLVAFLNELLFLKDKKKMIYSKVRVVITANGTPPGPIESWNLKATVFGEKIDQIKHKIKVDAKAATYSELKVEKEGDKWIAQCIIDV
jgi:SHS2 domain-containing protein